MWQCGPTACWSHWTELVGHQSRCQYWLAFFPLFRNWGPPAQVHLGRPFRSRQQRAQVSQTCFKSKTEPGGSCYSQINGLYVQVALTFSSGFLPLRGALFAGLLGKSTVEASGFLFSSEMMVVGHLVRPVRSAGKKYACAAGVLLFVPFITLKLFRREEGQLQRLVRPPVTRATGRSLQLPICNFLYLQGCLCKCWVVNYQKYM
jgi:hypothetical protein